MTKQDKDPQAIRVRAIEGTPYVHLGDLAVYLQWSGDRLLTNKFKAEAEQRFAIMQQMLTLGILCAVD